MKIPSPLHLITTSTFHLIIVFLLSTTIFTTCCKQKTNIPIWIWAGGIKDTNVHYWDSVFFNLQQLGVKGFLIHSGRENLEKVITVADKYNIEIHAWIWTMNRGDADSSWLSYNRLGKSLAKEKAYVEYYKFMCPALPEVKDFLSGKFTDLAKTKGLKGIHMDYIRYVDAILPEALQPKYGLVQDHVMPEFDYGYHPYMCKLFQEKTGIDPLQIKDSADYKQWLEFRLEKLNETVFMLRDQVRSYGLKISAAVFPTPAMSRKMVRQDWASWDLDYYFPMVYHNFYNRSFDWITRVMEEDRSTIPDSIKIFCGLYLPAIKKDGDLTRAIHAAMKGGADGVSLFSFGSLNNEMMNELKKIQRGK